MEPLPGRDALFLAVETDTGYAHIGGLTILDPTGPSGDRRHKATRPFDR
jgi:hypothetical protein